MKKNEEPIFEVLFDRARNELTKEFLLLNGLIPRIWAIFENEIISTSVNEMVSEDKDAFASVLLQLRTDKIPYVFASKSRVLFGEKHIKEALEKDGVGISKHHESKECLIMNSFDSVEAKLYVNVIKNGILNGWESFADQKITGRFGDE